MTDMPARRWLALGLVLASTLLVVVGTLAFLGMSAQRDPVEGIAGTSSPPGAQWAEPLAFAFALVIVSFVGALAALVVRYRRSDAHDRVQLRWVAFGGAVFLGVYVVTLPLASALGEYSTAGTIITAFSVVAFAALPIAIGAGRVRDEVDLDHLAVELRSVVSETMQPAHVSLWLREAGR